MILTLPSCVWRPPSVCVVVPLNGGCGGCRVVPLSSCCSASPRLILAPLLSVCCGWHDAGGEVQWCVVVEERACPTPSRIVQSPFSFCVLCHSIVGLVLCHCGMAVVVCVG